MFSDMGFQDDPGVLNEIKFEDHLSNQISNNNLNVSVGRPYVDYVEHVRMPYVALSHSLNNNTSPSSTSSGDETPELPEVQSDMVLQYINKMLMEEDMDEKLYTHQFDSVLQAAEKSLSDIITEGQASSPDQPPLYSDNLGSPGDSGDGHFGNSNDTNDPSGSVDNGSHADSGQGLSSQAHDVSAGYSTQYVSGSFSSASNDFHGKHEGSFGNEINSDLFFQSLPVWHFHKGVEEANKFLPDSRKWLIDIEPKRYMLRQNTKEESKVVELKKVEVSSEDKMHVTDNGSRGQKHPHFVDSTLEDGRKAKQSAVYVEGIVRSDEFDAVLLCNGTQCTDSISTLRDAMQVELNKMNLEGAAKKGSSGGKSKGKKQVKKEVIDLRALLIQCAQSVASDDRVTANELLKRIRQHSSHVGDGSQRLAYCFANGLEARLAGTGSKTYHSLLATRTTAADILNAYKIYMAASPFKKISHYFTNRTILKAVDSTKSLHVIEYGIGFGFQWPCFMQRLSQSSKKPLKLRITGIDEPQAGFHPTERIEETGRRLKEYALMFGIPFEFQSFACKWENISAEDLNIQKNEVVIVSSLYSLRTLADETVLVDSPRDIVLKNIRKMNPDIFIHGIMNGSFNAPFFVTRFREALFHFSSMFDMLESTIPREQQERLCIERELLGREALNVIACEGLERVQRPETYKQWQVRNRRAGFTLLQLDAEILKDAMDKFRSVYNKEFVIDNNGRWLQQGWKGRILYALSTWKPTKADV